MSADYTIEYCANCDGGYQEYSTAEGAIKAVHPQAKIKAVRTDSYPIVVKITDASGNLVWTSDQRNLFMKYAAKRTKSIEEIKVAVGGSSGGTTKKASWW